MKVILVSDLHAALRLPYAWISADGTRSDRLDDVCRVLLEDVVSLAHKEGAKHLMILGDLFHSRHPDAPTLKAISHALKHLVDMEIEVWILPGNHDAHGRGQAGQGVYSISFLDELQVPGIHVIGQEPFRLSKKGPLFAGVPWRPEPDAAKRIAELACLAERVDILLLHQEIKGATDQGRPMTRGLDQATLDEFGLVLSGHVHTPQHFEECEGAYLGSPIELRFSEADGYERGLWVLDTKEMFAELHPITTSPKFVRWHLEPSDGASLMDRFCEESGEFFGNLWGVLETRDVYLETRLTGPRAEVEKAGLGLADVLFAPRDAPHKIRKIKNDVNFTDVGGSRVRQLTSGQVASSDELVAAYVHTFADEAQRDELAAMGREFLQ